MSDEIVIPTEPTAAPTPEVETALDRKRRADRERKRLERAEARVKEAEDQSLETKAAIVTAQWDRNFRKLSMAAKKELNSRIEDFEYIEEDLLYNGSHRISAGEPYGGTECGIEFYPERFFAEIENFAEQHPPLAVEPFDFTNLRDQPYHFREYGVECDGLNLNRYVNWLRYFAEWYKQNRNILVLEQDPDDPFSRTWEQIDEIIESNPRLKNYVAVAPRPRQAAPPPPVVPKATTAEESAARTLAEITPAGHNRIRGLQSF